VTASAYGIQRGAGWQTLTLPVPPSINNAKRPGFTDAGALRLFTVKAVRSYQRAIAPLVEFLRPGPADRDVIVSIVWYRASKQDGDVDNRLKLVLDCLTGYAYADDRQIQVLTIARTDAEPHAPRFVLTITEAPA
jgi:Holliday junction resolvase RusA-like endonuclease